MASGPHAGVVGYRNDVADAPGVHDRPGHRRGQPQLHRGHGRRHGGHGSRDLRGQHRDHGALRKDLHTIRRRPAQASLLQGAGPVRRGRGPIRHGVPGHPLHLRRDQRPDVPYHAPAHGRHGPAHGRGGTGPLRGHGRQGQLRPQRGHPRPAGRHNGHHPGGLALLRGHEEEDRPAQQPLSRDPGGCARHPCLQPPAAGDGPVPCGQPGLRQDHDAIR